MCCQRLLPDVLPSGQVPLTSHHLHLDPAPRQVRTARSFVREHAPPMPADSVEVLLLLTSELVTNAILHARTAIELGITVATDCVLVCIHDEDLTRPEQQPYDGREGGWGLGLVRSLSASSGMTVHPGDGKTAWFVVPRSAQIAAEPGAAVRQGQAELGTAGT